MFLDTCEECHPEDVRRSVSIERLARGQLSSVTPAVCLMDSDGLCRARELSWGYPESRLLSNQLCSPSHVSLFICVHVTHEATLISVCEGHRGDELYTFIYSIFRIQPFLWRLWMQYLISPLSMPWCHRQWPDIYLCTLFGMKCTCLRRIRGLITLTERATERMSSSRPFLHPAVIFC